ncbi:MAG TPA: hypothetical protein VLQ48_02845 [Chloroflexia bacterium]|nr:hypothetical protein [Chloroflexia bacterium]
MTVSHLRFPLMGLGMIALVAAMWAGLMRLGFSLPMLNPTLPGAHGALMVGGFLGTVIGLERAVALRKGWGYVAPALSALGVVALLVLLGMPYPLGIVGPVLLTLSSITLVVLYVSVLRVQPTLFIATMALGAVVWACGNILWLVWLPIYQTSLWWAGFLILTIAGERLELTRMLPRSLASSPLFMAAIAVFLGGLATSVPWQDAGTRLMSVGLVALALWLGRYDIARRTVRGQGLTRYIATGLLAGYAWMLVAGGLALAFGAVTAGPRYDALLHSIFLGFVMSMIFAHAPIILPAVTGLSVPYRQAFYAHLALLHTALALRVASDLLGWVDGRQWGGLLSVFALLLFMGNTGLAVLSGARAATGRKQTFIAHETSQTGDAQS